MMTEKRKSSKLSKLGEDELIKSLAPDPSQLPDLRILFGFLGRSSQEGYWRLYLTPELNNYIEFLENDAVHFQRLGVEQTSLGGTIVWFNRDTKMNHIRIGTQQTQADFLQGDIAERFLTEATLRTIPGMAAVPIGSAISWCCQSLGTYFCCFMRSG